LTVVPALEAVGERVGLRRLKPADAGERYLRWMNDPDTNRYLESRFATHTVESLREYVNSHDERDDTIFLAIVRLEDGEHIGNVKVGPLDPHHGTADLGLLIGERSARGIGYGTEVIRLATRLGFENLGARKLTASCYSDNVASATAFRRAGWEEEGSRAAQFTLDDGRAQDQLLFGVTRKHEPASNPRLC
jgi:RimJ/RimL family protein N-acetyltransferase